MAVRIQIRNGTASEWASANPILAIGELAIETDTRKFKIGNGNQAWNVLPYAEQGETGLQGPIGKSIQYIWSGTQLGIRVEGESTYQYIDLIGPKGIKAIRVTRAFRAFRVLKETREIREIKVKMQI